MATPPEPPRVLISNWVHPEVINRLEPHCRVIANLDRDRPWRPEEILRYGREASAWMAFMPDRADGDVLDQLPRLRIIAGALKGYDNFDVDACTARGIWFSIVPDLLTEPTAELTVGLMIGLARHILAGDAHIRSGEFQGWRPRWYGRGLAGSRVGILGAGAVGQAIAARLRPFGAELHYHDRQRLDPVQEAALGLCFGDWNTVIGGADYLVLALPLNTGTRHCIDATTLARLPRGSLLINPARGSLVNEGAVVEALTAGHLGGYAADVFELEDWRLPDRPRRIDHRLLNLTERTLFTPHLGSAVDEVRQAIALQAADNILAALRGETPPGAVNRLDG